jgi:hypothetical protein
MSSDSGGSADVQSRADRTLAAVAVGASVMMGCQEGCAAFLAERAARWRAVTHTSPRIVAPFAERLCTPLTVVPETLAHNLATVRKMKGPA